MHEIGVVRSMVKTVTAFAEANQITDIAEIVVDVGELSLVIPEYVEELEHKGYCPHCGSFEKTILTGRDFLIREIHIPE